MISPNDISPGSNSPGSDRLDAPDEAPSKVPFEHLSQSRARAILNCLLESTFFYREDDQDLFDYLRRHRAQFERFFDTFFGWNLHVDRKCARLFKRRQYNPALTPKQRNLFDLTRRDECILFMLLLEFHESQLAALNVHYEHDEDLHFILADFVSHAVARFRKELEDTSPSDREIVSNIQSLFRRLEKHRFIRQVERGEVSTDEKLLGGQTEHILYAFLPGLHCYDPARLSSAVFERAPPRESAPDEEVEA